MKCNEIIIRLHHYIRAYGILKAVHRVFDYLKTCIIPQKYNIFFVELADIGDELPSLPESITIESKKSRDSLSFAEIERLSSYWINAIVRDNIEERFTRADTSIWLLQIRGEIAAFAWTTTRVWARDRFIPYGPRDVYIFDAATFPEYRGRRYQSILEVYILRKLKHEGLSRCFIHVHELNEAMLRSIGRGRWQKLGAARALQLFGNDIVVWSNMGSGNDTTTQNIIPK